MKNTILEKLKEEAQQYLAEPAQETFIERKKKEFVIDASIEYPDPEYLIEIGGVPTLPRGNLVALSAKWKNGKTFLCDVLSAIFLGSDRFAGCRPKCPGGKVQFFDTEQAMSDTARIRKTIKKLTPQERHKDFDVFCLRKAGIDYAVRQIRDLQAHGADGIHIYTMNRPQIATQIMEGIR